jgi:hypothetical protein
MKNVENPQDRIELRKWVWVMLMRVKDLEKNKDKQKSKQKDLEPVLVKNRLFRFRIL